MREIHRHHPVDPSYRPFDERSVAAVIRKTGSSTALGPWRARHALLIPPPSRGARPGLHDRALQPLSCRSRHPGNLEELSHNTNPESREVQRARPLLAPYLAALPFSEDLGTASPPVHQVGAGHSLLTARLQTEAVHHLGPAPHFCSGGSWF